MALVERYVGEPNDRLEPVLKQAGPEQKLDALVRGCPGLLQGKRDLARVVSRRLFGGMATPLGPLAPRVEERVLRSVQNVMEEGASTGAFRPLDPRLAAFSLLGMLHVFLAEELLTGEVTPPRELADHTVSMATAALGPNPVLAERR